MNGDPSDPKLISNGLQSPEYSSLGRIDQIIKIIRCFFVLWKVEA